MTGTPTPRQREREARNDLTSDIWIALTEGRGAGYLDTAECIETMHQINEKLKRYARAIRARAKE